MFIPNVRLKNSHFVVNTTKQNTLVVKKCKANQKQHCKQVQYSSTITLHTHDIPCMISCVFLCVRCKYLLCLHTMEHAMTCYLTCYYTRHTCVARYLQESLNKPQDNNLAQVHNCIAVMCLVYCGYWDSKQQAKYLCVISQSQFGVNLK